MVQALFGPPEKKAGLFDRLKKAVASTKAQLVERIDEIVEGRETIDPGVLDSLEATLISADLGVKTTQEILACAYVDASPKALGMAERAVMALDPSPATPLPRSTGGEGRRTHSAGPQRSNE